MAHGRYRESRAAQRRSTRIYTAIFLGAVLAMTGFLFWAFAFGGLALRQDMLDFLAPAMVVFLGPVAWFLNSRSLKMMDAQMARLPVATPGITRAEATRRTFADLPGWIVFLPTFLAAMAAAKNARWAEVVSFADTGFWTSVATGAAITLMLLNRRYAARKAA
ncbi:hypothetical protein [Croceicoccus sp. BE223]|uniref:hypothetical protein n=1 Tax=Croceicoccus sp. BE223 TaxID=2817716 RepID=UPI0028577D90|nr:hypothetical protein [Croceicoccus sp. BE223]MDR7102523.1 hypothetical protein [Croceicoccus sp. BE223]